MRFLGFARNDTPFSFFCYVELALSSRGSAGGVTALLNPRGAKLKLQKHPVAGKKKNAGKRQIRNLTIAEQNLNYRSTLPRGRKKE